VIEEGQPGTWHQTRRLLAQLGIPSSRVRLSGHQTMKTPEVTYHVETRRSLRALVPGVLCCVHQPQV